MYNVFILSVTLLSIHLVSTIQERLLICIISFLVFYFFSKRLALTEKKLLAASIFGVAATAAISLHLSRTIFKFFPKIFGVAALIILLLCVYLTFTKKKKLTSGVLAGIISLVVSSTVLTDVHRFVLNDNAVMKFAEGQFNAMGFDSRNFTLFAIGDGINHVHAFNVNDLNAPPKISEIETGRTETAFLLNEKMNEIYMVPRIRKGAWTDEYREFNILEANSLKLKESIKINSAKGIGGQWIGADPHTGYIILAAESARQDLPGATLIISRADRKIVKKLPLAPMNMLMHTHKPLVYLSFFQNKGNNEIICYDLQSLAIKNRVQISARMDRMAYLESANELLVTLPANSMIYRLDADTLRIKGKIKASFGVRALAVDVKRNLLLTASLVTNNLDVIELQNYRRSKRYYLAPWLRSIVLDGSGTAYVSCATGLFRVNYSG